MSSRPPALAHLRFREQAAAFEGLDLEARFTRIFETNLWGSDQSRSGLGSALRATEYLREAIPALLRSLGAGSLLDLPCGDFGWLSQADLTGIDYTGADIVPALIERNRREHGGAGRRFLQLDLTRDPLPTADVVLCRDCLVHLSFENIARALANIRASGARYLLATTFPGHAVNEDIADGDWRLLNMEAPPIGLPPAVALIVEGCGEGDGAYADKSLGLWTLRDA